MVDVREAPYSGIYSPGTIPESISGRYVLLLWRLVFRMIETGEAILSGDTVSFKAVIVAGTKSVSHTGDTTESRDMNKTANIADAKFGKRTWIF